MSFTIPHQPVSLLRLFLKMGGWFVVVAGVSILLFTLFSHLSLQTARQFEREGLHTQAIVTKKYDTENRDADGDRTMTYWLTLEYVTESGEEITLNRSVRLSTYRSAQIGAPLDLLYLRSAPTTTEVTPGSNLSTSRVAQGIALVMGLVWLAALWIVGGWAVSAVRARRYGARETASVTQVRKTNVKINRGARYRLVWTDAQGREGTSLLHQHANLAGFQAGDQIDIYQGVKHAWWVGDIGERPEFAQ